MVQGDDYGGGGGDDDCNSNDINDDISIRNGNNQKESQVGK